MYLELQKRANDILEKGLTRFNNIKRCLEERATVKQLSELSPKVDTLMNRVEVLKAENMEVGFSPSLVTPC